MCGFEGLTGVLKAGDEPADLSLSFFSFDLDVFFAELFFVSVVEMTSGEPDGFFMFSLLVVLCFGIARLAKNN
jgi:hypothetical protein